MDQIVEITNPDELALVNSAPGLPALSPDKLETDHPDGHRVVVAGDGLATARCSLWWSDTPPYPEHSVGLIGHFAAADAPSAATLLDAVCDELRTRGCTLAIGPMDGSTWRSYRLVTDPGTEPPFFLEPANPPEWPGYFETAGFTALATFTSALNDNLAEDDPRLARAKARFAQRGISIRTLDPTRFEDELRHIFRVAEVSFRDNFLYTPTTGEDFVRQYDPVRSLLDPELVLIAEHDDTPVAFLFMIPDFNQGASPDTAILKTVAIIPGRVAAGLGTLLVNDSHVRARNRGYRRVIHALMHDSNPSIRISRKSARTIRRYALFSRELLP